MDEKTLIQLYRVCYPDIARYIMNRNGTPEEAEEAFHAALGAMLQQMEKGATINDYGAYLFRSAWNAFLAERRHTTRFDGSDSQISAGSLGYKENQVQMDEMVADPIRKVGFRLSGMAEPGPGPDQHLERKILLEAAEASIGELSRSQQKVLQLSFDPETNLDDDAIAERLGVTKAYVRVARFRAMEALRAQMYKRGFGYML